ncbi:hypothetical protein NQ176_g8169 [Zarea fungicola]|uniref:Uncharacterized protein n=1 Tax=Zarea fungicola TaxID=93591 RepID=A0ACC1MTZ3_9HYPO|nr:hypothetical protein NQ176_g8169 [Lecanicillium fungicola]
MAEEIKSHSLQGIVQIRHRDVYREGFMVDGQSPNATAVFLDLPAPWKAIQHLSRRGGASPLDPKRTAYICTFSPCIEQVTRTVNELRTLGWVDVDMVEISQRRLNITRERVGVNLPNERGNTQTPADVLEAVTKLRKVNRQNKQFQSKQLAQNNGGGRPGSAAAAESTEMDIDSSAAVSDATSHGKDSNTHNHQSDNATEAADDQEKPFMQGRLVHRSEPDLKTHTSYLVFALLPPEWTDEDEAKALAKWPCGQESKVIGNLDKQARKKEKREQLESRSKKRKANNDTQAKVTNTATTA